MMETELKFSIPDNSIAEKILQDGRILTLRQEKNWQIQNMISWYLDTDDFWLARKLASLRLRLENEKLHITMKMGKTGKEGLHQREEWTRTLAGEISSADFLARPGALLDYTFAKDKTPDELQELLRCLTEKKLTVICKIMFQRLKGNLDYNDTLLEIAFDQGCAECDSLKAPISEIELEIIRGSVHNLLDFGQWLRDKYNLKPENRSKLARCLEMKNIDWAVETDA